MIILGIDPAIRTTGYAIIEGGELPGAPVQIRDCGVIANSPKLPHTECLRRLYGGIEELISLWHPDHAVLEEPFVGRNAKTAIILGMARGGILSALANHAVPACAYNPSVAKRAVTGSGRAEKAQIAFLLAAEFGIEVERIPLDSTDAVALAMCHLQRVRQPEFAPEGKMI